jgi:hypothetical protein
MTKIKKWRTDELLGTGAGREDGESPSVARKGKMRYPYGEKAFCILIVSMSKSWWEYWAIILQDVTTGERVHGICIFITTIDESTIFSK